MPMLVLKIFVVILALLAMMHLIREWIDRRKLQKRIVALKDWIQKQDKPPAAMQIRLAHPGQSD